MLIHRRPAAALLVALMLASTLSTSPVAAVSPAPFTGAAPILVGAGDIADCATDSARATARLLGHIPGTVITLGDNVYPSGSASGFRRCYDPTWGRYKARTRPAAGNHDYEAPGAGPYFAYFGAAAGVPGEGWYSYDLGTWHIVVLNSDCAAVAGCGPGSPQVDWLRQDLARHAGAHILAYWHHPLFSSGSHGSSSSVRTFWKVLYQAGAELVLNGHDHDYERFARQDASGRLDNRHGIREFVVGTGGAPLRPRASEAPNSRTFRRVHGVLELTLRSDGYSWRFVPVGRTTWTDTGSTRTHAAPP